jgi:hypothetical protein
VDNPNNEIESMKKKNPTNSRTEKIKQLNAKFTESA